MLRLSVCIVAGLGAWAAFLCILDPDGVAIRVGIVFGLVGIPLLVLRLARPVASEGQFTVTLDATEIVVQRPDGQRDCLALAALARIRVLTNDSGPWGSDVLWVLEDSAGKSVCTFPQGARGEARLLEFVQRLPGFDNEAFILAMGSTANAQFLCWQKAA